jgi:hypothetical protein
MKISKKTSDKIIIIMMLLICVIPFIRVFFTIIYVNYAGELVIAQVAQKDCKDYKNPSEIKIKYLHKIYSINGLTSADCKEFEIGQNISVKHINDYFALERKTIFDKDYIVIIVGLILFILGVYYFIRK